MASLGPGPVAEFAITAFRNHGSLKLEHAARDEATLPDVEEAVSQLFPDWVDG